MALWRDSNAATVALIRDGKFDEVSRSVPNKVSDLLDCEPITALIRHAGGKTVQTYLEAELIKLAGNFNGNPALNLKDYQVPVLAEMLIENYKWESIEDFTLCFRKAMLGMYGEIYRIDGAVIGQWMARYLEEKYDALEQRKAKEKKQESEVKRVFQSVDASKYIKQMLEQIGPPDQKDETNAKENGYQRYKLENQSRLSPDHLRKILKQEHPEATPEEIEKAVQELNKPTQ